MAPDFTAVPELGFLPIPICVERSPHFLWQSRGQSQPPSTLGSTAPSLPHGTAAVAQQLRRNPQARGPSPLLSRRQLFAACGLCTTATHAAPSARLCCGVRLRSLSP